MKPFSVREAAFSLMKIITTGLAGGLWWPYKGLLPANILRCSKWYAIRSTSFSCNASPTNPKGLFYFFPTKRVNVLFYTYLIFCNIFLQLCANIFRDLFSVFSNCIYIVSSAPEVPVPIFISQVCILIEYHQGAFPF